MQSTIEAAEKSPFYNPNRNTFKSNTYGLHTKHVYGDVPQCEDPLSIRYTARERALDAALSGKPIESMPPLTLQKSSSSPAKSSARDSFRSNAKASSRDTGRSRPATQHSYRSRRSNNNRPGTSQSLRSSARSAISTSSRRDQVQDWIQTEFGKCGDQLFEQIVDASR